MKQALKLFVFICILWNTDNLMAQNKETVDSVSYVANRLMHFDVYINSYVISDAESDWIEADHTDWILKYYPSILEQYDCTLYSKFSIAVSLYINGKSEYMVHLWSKYGYLFEVNGNRSGEQPVQKIWQLLDLYKINPHELK